MRIPGEWYWCDDGVIRPVVRGEVANASGGWEPTEFLLDTGADRTVFAAATLRLLGFEAATEKEKLVGIGGTAESVAVPTEIRLTPEGGDKVFFEGRFAGFTDPRALDMSVLGRDIMSFFAVIFDEPADVIAMIRDGHRYRIE